MFDRVFCISVLEHMPPADRAAALREFARIVRPDGLVVLTMDHPLVDLGEFVRLVAAAGLRFVGDVRLHVPPDALASPDRRLRCFRALLQRA
jgi:ubiquinone/menaquinone biosynthesis C-methylase UbiE